MSPKSSLLLRTLRRANPREIAFSLQSKTTSDESDAIRPDPYVKGAAALGFHTAEARANTIVFEDAPNGILSGKAAGCQTLAVLTSHRRDQVEPTQPTFLVNDLTRYVAYDGISLVNT